MRGWQNQIKFIDSVWDKLEHVFDRQLFTRMFSDHCRELSLPYQTYDIDAAFKQATTTWRVDLMLEVVEHILHHYIDDISLSTKGFVEGHEKDKRFSIDVKKTIAEMESNDSQRKQNLKRYLLELNDYWQ